MKNATSSRVRPDTAKPRLDCAVQGKAKRLDESMVPGRAGGFNRRTGVGWIPGMNPMSYEEICAAHRWEVPARYNIAADVCDKHARDKPAMIW